jgi:arylsulfatase A-like enzyme
MTSLLSPPGLRVFCSRSGLTWGIRCIVRAPRDRNVATADLVPTLLDLLGVEVPGGLTMASPQHPHIVLHGQALTQASRRVERRAPEGSSPGISGP